MSGVDNARLYRNFLDLREPRFAPLVEYLKAELDKAETDLHRGVDLQTIFRAQGRADVLSNLLDSVANAAEYLKRARP